MSTPKIEYERARAQPYLDRTNNAVRAIRMEQLTLALNVAIEKKMLLELDVTEFGAQAPKWTVEFMDINWNILRQKQALVTEADAVIEDAKAALVDYPKIFSWVFLKGWEYRKTHLPLEGEMGPTWEEFIAEPATPRSSEELITDA